MLKNIVIRYDFDILFTTDNPNFVNGRYPNQRVVTYSAKKPHKQVFRKEDGAFDREAFDNKLFLTDTFSFGTKIGQITNTISTIVGMIPMFPKGSKEREVLESRVKAGCASQSRQIDKTKIGENVKELATVCRQFQHIEDEDADEVKEKKKFLNSILADKKPYFFRYKYRQTDKEYREYLIQKNEDCHQHFRITLDELLALPEDELTEEQKEFKDYYYRFIPVVVTNCVMNKICWYIESIDFDIKAKVRSSEKFDYRTLQSENFELKDKKLYEQIYELVVKTVKEWNNSRTEISKEANLKNPKGKENNFNKEIEYAKLRSALEDLCPNDEIVTNYLVQLFYVDKLSLNKNILWELYGRQIYENVRSKTNSCYFPKKNENGSIEFLYEKYSIEKVDLNAIEEDKEEEFEKEFEI